MEQQEGANVPMAMQVVDVAPTMVTSIAETKKRLADMQEFVREIMREGSDFGTIPGTPKPTLYKPGAEKLCEVYGLAPRPEVTQRTEDWERGFFFYEVRCDLISKRTGNLVASALGSCNSMEARYRWRNTGRACPQCKAEAIIEGKPEYGGGWVCFKKKGGCGAKFAIDAPEITGQQPGKVENDDPYTLVNTILKMADKRAQVAATLKATRSSDLFTQDIEDMGDNAPRSGQRPAQQDQQPRQFKEPQRKSGGASGAPNGAVGAAVAEIRMILEREYGDAAESIMGDLSAFTGKDNKERRLRTWGELEHASEKWVQGILRKVHEQCADAIEPPTEPEPEAHRGV